jgi:hypothetical protein
MVKFKAYNEWTCPQHLEHPNPNSGRHAKGFADRYWRDHGGLRPFPASVEEFLERAGELRITSAIQLDYSKPGNFPKIADRMIGAAGDRYGANDNERQGDNDNEPISAGMQDVLDGDFIPF